MELLKYGVLIVLVFLCSSHVLALRYTRTAGLPQERYISSTVVLLSELLKILSSFFIIFFQSGCNHKKLISAISEGVLGNLSETMKMMIPAAVYALQNNLLFVALSYLDAGTYQVTYQLKILTTAIFSVVLLKRTLSVQQWIALLLLTIGVALVQLPTGEVSFTPKNISDNGQMIGLFVVILSSVSSGFAGVYFELLLKTSTIPFGIRSLQMAFFAFCFSALALYLNDRDNIAERGFLHGYNKAVIGVLCLQAFGGLLVAFAIQQTDNITKNFAIAMSIILSTLISYFFLQDLKPTRMFAVGTCIVLVAIFLYGMKSSLFSACSSVKKLTLVLATG